MTNEEIEKLVMETNSHLSCLNDNPLEYKINALISSHMNILSILEEIAKRLPEEKE